MPPFTLTTERLTPDETRETLKRFIFGGRYAPVRPPRGLDLKTTHEFVRTEVALDNEPEVFAKTLQIARYYEITELPKHWHLLWHPPARTDLKMTHACFALQAVGDFSDDSLRKEAFETWEQLLIPHSQALLQTPLLAETYVALAPGGALKPLEQRLQIQLNQLEPDQRKTEESLREYQKTSAFLRQDVAQARHLAEGKQKILSLPPEQKRRLAVQTYLRKSPYADPYMDHWTGRLLRKEAQEQSVQPIQNEFLAAIDQALGKDEPDPAKHAFIVTRAIQAIIYLQGAPPRRYMEIYSKIKEPVMNFLWDDMEEIAINALRQGWNLPPIFP